MKILVCSDGSERAVRALTLAGRIAAATNAEVTLFGVTESEAQEEIVYAGLHRALKEFERNGINVELLTKRGEPIVEIAKRTRATKYDLVVVGTQRKANERGGILPDKAYAIIEAVEPPVLVATGQDRELKRILLSTTGGPCIGTAVHVTAELARGVSAFVTLLTVVPNLGGIHAGLIRREADADALLRSNSVLARDLRAEKRVIEGLGVRTTVRLRYGLVADEILKELEEGDHDVVVVGACPEPTAWRRYLLGNVTREIVQRADRPVLVVRSEHALPEIRESIGRALGKVILGLRRKPQ